MRNKLLITLSCGVVLTLFASVLYVRSGQSLVIPEKFSRFEIIKTGVIQRPQREFTTNYVLLKTASVNPTWIRLEQDNKKGSPLKGFAADHLLVSLKERTNLQELERVVQRASAKVDRELGQTGVFIISFQPQTDVNEVYLLADSLRKLDSVAIVEDDEISF